MFIFNNFSTCFGHHYAHLQENKTYVTACVVLRCFCWMCLVAVVGHCLVGCASVGSLDTTLAKPRPNCNTQQIKNETANVAVQQHSRKLLNMGILMPETC